MVVRLVHIRTGAASHLRARSAAVAALAVLATPAAAAAPAAHRPAGGRAIPAHFAGLSLEWTLVDRYMGPRARPAFVNLLRNLGTGVLRIGGGSQEESRVAARAADSERVVTAADLAAVRATLDAVNAGGPRWRVVLGAGIAGAGRSRALAAAAARAFAGAEADVAGIELGNEPDVAFGYDAGRYLRAVAASAGEAGRFAPVGPSTSEPIAPWRSLRAHAGNTRFFWDWERILAAAPGAYAADHFYPLARGCVTYPYRCATIARLLSRARLDNLGYQVYAHATAAARHGLGYRVEEMNSAAGRGAHGVSDVAASAAWALEAMFTAACPQPPDAPGANADCHAGATGVNFHAAERYRFFASGEGDAYYNPVAYTGGPHAAPEYYALLFFGRLAQGARGLAPLAAPAPGVSAWRVAGRVFLINRGRRARTAVVPAAGTSAAIDRMTPYDPSGRGRTLAAPNVRIDGRSVAADGRWPGERPQAGAIAHGRIAVALAPGEAVAIAIHR